LKNALLITAITQYNFNTKAKCFQSYNYHHLHSPKKKKSEEKLFINVMLEDEDEYFTLISATEDKVAVSKRALLHMEMFKDILQLATGLRVFLEIFVSVDEKDNRLSFINTEDLQCIVVYCEVLFFFIF
jgi:hypothetical protein